MSDQFKVSILVELQDRFSNGVKAMAGALGSVQNKMEGMNSTIGKFKQLSQHYSQIASLGKSMAGLGMSGMKEALDPAKEYVHQLNLMKLNNLEIIEQEKNKVAAWKTARDVMTSTPAENLAALADMRSVLTGKNSMEEARQLLPDIQKAQAIFDASRHMLHGHSSKEMAFSAVKAVEMMGRNLNPEEFRHQFSEQVRTAIGTGGRVLPTHLQQVLKYAKSAKMGLSDDFLQNKLPELVIENQTNNGGGASVVGTMVNAGYRQIVQHTMKIATAMNLMHLGLLDHPVFKAAKKGKGQTLEGGGVVGDAVFAKDPEVWVRQYLLPALYRQNPSLKGDRNALNMAISKTFLGNQGAISLYQELAQKGQSGAFNKLKSIRDKIPGLDKSYKTSKEDPDQGYKALDASLKTLHTAVGVHVLPIIVPAITALAGAINQAGQYINAHPAVGKGIASFMASMVVVGNGISWVASLMGVKMAMSILAPGLQILKFCGWLGLALAAVTAIILVIQNWDKVMGFWKETVNNLKLAFALLLEAFPGLDKAIQNLKTALSGWTNQMGGVVSQVAKFFPQILDAMLGPLNGAVKAASNLIPKDLAAKWKAAANNENGVDMLLAKHGIGMAPQALAQQQAANAWYQKTYSQKTSGVTQHINQQIKVDIKLDAHGGKISDAEHAKLARKAATAMSDAHRHACASHPLAGGNHVSYAFFGAH